MSNMDAFMRKKEQNSNRWGERQSTNYKGFNFFADKAAQKEGYKNAKEKENIETGKGRMVDGKYQEYTAADRQHLASASENSQADYQDIAYNSQLGRYSKPKNQSRAATGTVRRGSLLGGFTPLGG